MLINYSGQPYEPVIDMQTRAGRANILYEEVETLRIHHEKDEYKLISIPYGVLRHSTDNPTHLGKMCRRLNSEDSRKIKYNYATENYIESKNYLPIQSGDVQVIERLCKRYVRTKNVQPLFYPLFTDLHDVAKTLDRGLFLCRYIDSELPVKIQVFGTSTDGLALVQMMYILKPDPLWKYAIIDSRETYTGYKYKEKKKFPQGTEDFGSEMLTQEQIDKLIKFQLENL